MQAIDIKKQKQTHLLERFKANFVQTCDNFEASDLDLSDIGEQIGQILKQEFEPNSHKFGFNIDDFISGLRVGLNLNKNIIPYDKAIDSMLNLVQKDLIVPNLEQFDAELRQHLRQNTDKI
jgi:hypothetical protein